MAGFWKGVAEWFKGPEHRSTQYVATNTKTGEVETFTILDNIAPDWSTDDFSGYMGIPGAWRAATLIADLIGAVPWHAYRERAGKPVEKLDPQPSLLEQPAPPDTRMTTFSSWALDLIWHGNAIGLVAAWDSDGRPTAVTPVPANTVMVRRTTKGDGSGLAPGTVEYQVGNLRGLTARDVFHVKGPCPPGALRGMGVLETHLNTFKLASEQNRQARSLSQHGVPTGTLKSDNPDLTEDEAKDLKAAWLKAQRERTVAVLNSTTHFTPLAWNPEELQLVEARKFTIHELALIFGVPLSFLGVEQSSRTYTNTEMESLNLLRFHSPAGHIARFEQTLTQLMPRGTYVKANLDAFQRPDTKSRYEAHAIGIDKGFLTIDEVRGLEERPPLPPKQQETTDDSD